MLSYYILYNNIKGVTMGNLVGKKWGKKNQSAYYNNVFIKQYASLYGYEFVDLFSPLVDMKTGEVFEGYTIDGGHFLEVGYNVVSSLIKPAINRALEN